MLNLNQAIHAAAKQDPWPWAKVYWYGLHITVRLDCIGQSKPVSFDRMNLTTLWRRLWTHIRSKTGA